jgi:hypothetical protein
MDGGGFKKRGGWHNEAAGGTEVLVHALVRRGGSGHNNLPSTTHSWAAEDNVSILAVGPESNRRELGKLPHTKNRIKPGALSSQPSNGSDSIQNPCSRWMSEMGTFQQ